MKPVLMLAAIMATCLSLGCGRVTSSTSSSLPERRADPYVVWQIVSAAPCRDCGSIRPQIPERLSMANEHVFYKSLANHTLAMQEDVVRLEGEEALALVPWLKDPLINPREEGSAARFLTFIQRDGRLIAPRDREILGVWIAQGAPLPGPEFQEALSEIRGMIARRRP